ncbi:MAG: DUF72 domain-containing protein [Actinomycetota bacterium]
MGGTLYLGTSGFGYPEWKGDFYPEDLKDTNMLSYYAGRFPSVEINYTFRRSPSPKTLETWAQRTGPQFRFALKAHGRITHTRRLADADELVSDFLDRARTLGERLGPILFQCPPTLRYDRGLIESFLAYLPPTFRYAMEFRHESWTEARDLLTEQGVAWCFAAMDQTAGDPVLSEPFVYLRLRRDEYDDDSLGKWAARIEEALADGRDVYAYFKHEEGTAAPRHATRLRELLGQSTTE